MEGEGEGRNYLFRVRTMPSGSGSIFNLGLFFFVGLFFTEIVAKQTYFYNTGHIYASLTSQT